MPAYRAAGVELRLSVHPLEDVTKLQNLEGDGAVLSEEALPYMGEQHGPHFLTDCSNTPFLFVRACGVKQNLKKVLMEKIKNRAEWSGRSTYSLRSRDTLPDRSSRSASCELHGVLSRVRERKHEEPQESSTFEVQGDKYSGYKALMLTIKLDPSNSFSRSMNFERAKDMKIDIYLNGSLVQCHFISNRTRHQDVCQTIRISGIRCCRASEKAWIVQVNNKDCRVPGLSNEDAEMHDAAAAQKSLQSRWENISKALLESADQYGFHKGDRTLSGKYLARIAHSPLPDNTDESFLGCENQFAVLDCVITLGTGGKYPTSCGYIREPKIMKDRNFQGGAWSDMSLLPTPAPAATQKGDTTNVCSPVTSNHPSDNTYPETEKDQEELFMAAVNEGLKSKKKTSLTKGSEDIQSNRNFSKGPSRVPLKGSSGSTSAQTSYDSAISDTVEPTTPTTTAFKKGKTRLTLRYRRKALDPTTVEPNLVAQAAAEPSPDRKENANQVGSIKRGSARRPGPKVPLVEPGWKMPELSQDSVLTYVDGERDHDGVRAMRTERSGVFTEDEILLGVRYLLGSNAATE